MKKLVREIRALEQGPIGAKIKQRLAEFRKVHQKDNAAWFEELCFCILAANAKSRTSWAIQKELGAEGFLNATPEEITACILRNKHRFHNTKTKYIIAARKYAHIKDIVQRMVENNDLARAREWLVENVDGFGYKEASHFLRNVGYFDFAILDRHILNVMLENNILAERPQTITPKKYLEIEEIFNKNAEKMNMKPGELDFYFWYMKAGDVLK